MTAPAPQDAPSEPSATATVGVSVVVSSFNRADMLAETIESLTALDTELSDGERFTYEIVVIDNASTDHTPSVVERFTEPARCGAAVGVRGFHETEPGVTFARNRGLAEAQGEWIAFHDDDQRAHPRWLAELILLARRRDVKVTGGAVHLLLPESNTRELAPQCRRLLGEKVGWDEEMPYGRKRIPGTNNILIHRSVIERVGNFDTTLQVGGEDADLYRRIRSADYKAWYTPDAIVYHVIPEQRMTNEYMRWTATRHGQHVALRECRDWGRVKLSGMIVLRAIQASINYLPRFLWNTLTGNHETALGAKALLWRSGGYLRRACRLVAWGDVDESGQDPELSFREGREKLMKQATSP